MAFDRPTLAEIVSRQEAEIASRLGTGPLLRRSNLSVLARAQAGSEHMLHGHLAWLARQIVPDTAELEYLERFATIWGVVRKPAAFATGDLDFAGTSGLLIPAGSLVKRSDGQEYETKVDLTLAGGVGTVAVDATVAGELGDSPAGTILTLSVPITGVTSSATVASTALSLGADEETDEDLRVRFLKRVQQPPQGGADSDYELWALEVPEVTRAWALEQNGGLGTVDVMFVLDNDSASIIPNAAKVAEVQAYIDAPTRRPVTAIFTAVAPTLLDLDPEIVLTPDTTEVRANVQASLEELLLRTTAPGAPLLLTHIRQAISNAQGETDHALVSPVADVAPAAGQIVDLGTITWS